MKNLTLSSVKEHFPKAIVRKYHKGQIICYEGDKPQYVFFVAKGYVRYYDIDSQGNEKILHILGPGNLFPMLFAFEVRDEVVGFYGTLGPAEIITVPLQEFHKATQNDAIFSTSLTQWFLTEIKQLAFRISSLQKTDARDKIIYALKYLATDYGHPTGQRYELDFPITQQFIADLTGLARETVSNTMHELEVEGVVKTHKAHRLDVKASVLDKIIY